LTNISLRNSNSNSNVFILSPLADAEMVQDSHHGKPIEVVCDLSDVTISRERP